MRKVLINSQGKALLYNGQFLSVGNDYAYLTGNAPLSFQASAGPFGYLKQIGKCEQASSPTPSSPVDIYCNNGALKMVDDELPAGYKRIKSITFDGNVWYNTGEKLRGEDIITITLQPSVTTGQNIFGCYAGTSSGTENYSLYGYGSTSSSWYFRFGSTLYRPKTDSAKRTITVGPGTTTGFSTNVTVAPDTFETTSVAWIGGLPNSSSPKFKGDLFDSLTVGARLKWIPAERQSDGEIGYYEKFSGVFLENQGNGTPVKGDYDYSHLVVKAVGTPEVLTIGQQTASAQDLFAVGDYQDEQDIISGNVTRKIGIEVFDGTESYSSMSYGYATEYLNDFINENFAPLCTHFMGKTSASAATDTIRLYRTSGSVPRTYFFVDKTVDDFSTVDKFKAWLAAQYEAGTPVIVIYPLATETTESVAGQSLNTVNGSNVISVTAEVSEVPLDIEYLEA